MSFKEHPTLADLNAFAAEQRALSAKLRAACRKSCDAETEGRRLRDRVTDHVARRFKRVENFGDGRDMAVIAPGLRDRSKALREQAAEAEREATEIQRQIEASREGHQMESEDYDLYLSEGLKLPPHRRALYEANRLRAACESAYIFISTLQGMRGSSPEPDVLKELRDALSKNSSELKLDDFPSAPGGQPGQLGY